MRRFAARLFALLRPGRADASLTRELAAHLALLEDEYRRRGFSEGAARRAARLDLGGVDQTRERHRDALTFRSLDDLRRDAIYAVRMLRRRPVASATAILSLAIGIGLNAAIFSIVDWVLLRPLPFPAPHQLVRVFTAGTAPATGPSPLIKPEFERLSHATSLRRAAAFTTATRIVANAGAEPAHAVVARVNGDLFATLGVAPVLGRAFSDDELRTGAAVVVLSQETWRRRFAAGTDRTGGTLSIDGVPHLVVGVMASGRGYPRDADLWRPATGDEREDDDRELEMIARLNDGASPARATAELSALVQAFSSARTAWTEDVQRAGVANVSTTLQALFAAALLTLAIACANVAALVGARGADRAGEMVVRGALGATRGRVLGQLITESAILALLGGALGLVVGWWSLQALVALAPISIPRLGDVALDARLLALGFAVTLVTGLVVGVIPALRLSRATLAPAFASLSRRSTASASGQRVLVLAQIATAVVVTTGAALLSRSLQHLVSIDHGFAPDRLIAMPLYLRGSFDGDARQLYRDLVAASKAVPGVEAATVAMRLPTEIAGLRVSVTSVGDDAGARTATLRPIDPDYFAVTGITLLDGRPFAATETSTSARVAIVNEAFLRETLGSTSGIGRQVMTSIAESPIAIVGVVADVTPAGQADRPAIYVPIEQLPIGGGSLIVRTAGDPRAVMSALASRLRAAAPGLAIDRLQRVSAALEDGRAVTRFSTQVAVMFAGMALLLAMIGVYGLVASDVAGRWREMAVRLALGASRRDVAWTLLRPCARMLIAGAALGLLGAWSAGPALRSLLHGVDPADPPTLALTALVLTAIGLLAAIIAARPVLLADPAATLRDE